MGEHEPEQPEQPVVPARSQDDADRGWGGQDEPAHGDDDERFTRERPPHW